MDIGTRLKHVNSYVDFSLFSHLQSLHKLSFHSTNGWSLPTKDNSLVKSLQPHSFHPYPQRIAFGFDYWNGIPREKVFIAFFFFERRFFLFERRFYHSWPRANPILQWELHWYPSSSINPIIRFSLITLTTLIPRFKWHKIVNTQPETFLRRPSSLLQTEIGILKNNILFSEIVASTDLITEVIAT